MSVNIPNERQLDFHKKSKHCWTLIFVNALENITLCGLDLIDLAGMLCISKQLRTQSGDNLGLCLSALQRLHLKGPKLRPSSQSDLTCTKS